VDYDEDPRAETGPVDPFQHALGIALKYLNRRDRTVSEVRLRLERAAIDEGIATRVVDSLIEQGLIDDARFARVFAEDKRELEQWGSERIERGLSARGVDRELVREVLAETAGEDDLSRALSLLKRRFPTAPQNRRDRDRALGVLLRKGYDSELALDALAAHSRDAEAA
jgi:regulatory protein